MATQVSRKILNVFLASPGNLAEERRIAKRVVDEINRSIRELDWYVELLGWEDTLPGFARPQEFINRDVDMCDLFVGMLWRRWGQSTGTHESGFEEEFERARKRRLDTGSPEIWIVFRDIDPEQLNDPGEQLKRVIAFRKSLVESKELFFREFQDPEDWRAKFREWLSTHILRVYRSTIPTPQLPVATRSSSPQATEVTSPPTALEEKAEKGPAYSQLIDTINAAAEAVTSGEFSSIRDIREGPRASDKVLAARLYLFGIGWISELYTGEVLETHAINLLYAQREQLELCPPERNLLFRTLVADSYETSPGWFWFRDVSPKTIKLLLFYLASRDRNTLVRKRALQILNSVRIPPKDNELIDKETFIQRILADDSEEVVRAALNYLASCGDPEDLGVIRSTSSDNPLIRADDALETEHLIIIRSVKASDLPKLFPTLKSTEKKAYAAVEQRLADLDDDSLSEALKLESDSIRVRAIRELAQRKKLSTDQLREFLSDPSSAVKETCYEELIKRRFAVSPEEIRKSLPASPLFGPDPDRLILALFQSFDYERLISKVDWLSLDGPIAYRALALNHFPHISERVRSDLSNRFEAVRSKSIEKFSAENGELATELLLKGWSERDLDHFVRAEFTAAALAGLAVNGQPEDVVIAKQHLNESDNLRVEAIRVLGRFGNASDATDLVTIAKTSHGEVKECAAQGALGLSPGINGTARLLLEIDDPTLIGFAVAALLDENADEVGKLLEPLLGRANNAVRIKALTYFSQRYSSEQQEQLLRRYLQKSSYYYNVVSWLDRLLYAPPPLKDTFRRDLEARLD